jgi:hypothetical protein
MDLQFFQWGGGLLFVLCLCVCEGFMEFKGRGGVMIFIEQYLIPKKYKGAYNHV